MGFVKKNAFLLACAAVAVASLGLMIFGMSRMSRVDAEMSKAERLSQELARFTRDAVNLEAVEVEEQRIATVRQYHSEVLQFFEDAQKRRPLMDNVLPEPPKELDEKKLRYDFRIRYVDAMRRLLVRLNAGHVPTKEDIDNAADYLEKKRLQESGLISGDGASQRPDAAKVSLPPQEGPQSTAAYWQAVSKLAEQDPVMLTSISRARSIFCYANLDRGGSFELHPIFFSSGDLAPSLSDIWYAQLWFWIQEDIVEALARVNDRAAENLETPWVGNMPVKDVISIRISDYIQPQEDDALRAARGGDSDRPPGSPQESWTGEAASDLYDVINVRLRLAVDVRDLLQVLDALSDERFASMLNVSYQAIPPDLNFRGKVYGPEPVVEATIDVQTYLFYRSHVLLMPPAVREALGVEEQFQQLVNQREAEQQGDQG